MHVVVVAVVVVAHLGNDLFAYVTDTHTHAHTHMHMHAPKPALCGGHVICGNECASGCCC